MVYIAYVTELNLQICDLAKNDAFVAKIANMRLTKFFMAIFAPDERLPSSATLVDNNLDNNLDNHRIKSKKNITH